MVKSRFLVRGMASVGIAILLFIGVSATWVSSLQSEVTDLTESVKELRSMVDKQRETLDSLSLRLDSLESSIESTEMMMQATYDNLTGAMAQVLNTPDITPLGEYRLSAYTLQECGKDVGDVGYGITSTGVDLVGSSIHNSRYIGVNPDDIPYGSRVLIVMPEPYTYLTGVYEAVETGSAFNGKTNRIDVYFGESNVDEALQFGIRYADVYLLEGGLW